MRVYLMAALLLIAKLCAGQNDRIKNLKIGDYLPDLVFDNVLFDKGPVELRQYKGKLTILDFWGLTCYSCITTMPKLDSLQSAYKDKLQIILVTKDKADKILQFFSKRNFKYPNLPMIAGDTILSTYFPYKYLPHHVWINEEGKVIYITGGSNTNKTTIAAYFQGIPLDFAEVNTLMDFDISQPIWKEGGGRLTHHIKYYSLLTGHMAENPFSQIHIDDDENGVYGLKVINAHILELYKLAYGGVRKLGDLAKDERIILEVKDMNVFREPDPLKIDKWRRENFYCYEAVTPPLPEVEFCRLMQEELSRYLPYDVKIEKRKMKTGRSISKVDMLVIRDKHHHSQTKTNR